MLMRYYILFSVSTAQERSTETTHSTNLTALVSETTVPTTSSVSTNGTIHKDCETVKLHLMFVWKQKKGLMQCFSNIFSPSPHFHSRQGSKFKGFYLKKVWNSWTKPLKSWTKHLYYGANITFRILVKIIQGYRVGAPELGILPGDGAQI